MCWYSSSWTITRLCTFNNHSISWTLFLQYAHSGLYSCLPWVICACLALEDFYICIHILQKPSLPPYVVLLFIKWCLSIMRQAYFEGELSFQSLSYGQRLCVLVTKVTKPDVCFTSHSHHDTACLVLSYVTLIPARLIDSICLNTAEDLFLL